MKYLVGVARHPNRQAIERGVQLLIDKQQPNGDWPQVIESSLIYFIYFSSL